jgi:hypothetical protein
MGIFAGCYDGAVNMAPRWGYLRDAAMGLLTCRPDGATNMATSWGWGYGALVVQNLTSKKAFPNKPQRGKIFIEQKGYPPPSPVGAAP